MNSYLLVHPINGLANRLRVLISYKILSDALELPYYCYWKSGIGFDDTQLFELLDNPNDQLGVTQIQDESEYLRNRMSSIQLDKFVNGVSETKINEKYIKLQNIYAKNFLEGKFKKVSVKSCNLPNWSYGKILDQKIPNFKFEYKQIVKNLRVSKNVLETAGETLNKFSENTLGVHIRRGDACSIKNMKQRFHQDTLNNYILDYMRSYKGNIFLSTDCENVKNVFKKNLGEKLIIYNKKFEQSVYGEQKLGQFDAMVELYILSKTNQMLPTSPSSFGKFASDMGGDLYNKNSCKIIEGFDEIVTW